MRQNNGGDDSTIGFTQLLSYLATRSLNIQDDDGL